MDIDSLQHRFDTFRSLMTRRIREILLVSSVYDAYIIEEDGTLEERIWQQYADRGLSTVPLIRKVSSIERALEVIGGAPVDLVLAVVHEEADLALDLAPRVKALRPDLPVVLLVTDPAVLARLAEPEALPGVDRLFLWQNDPTLLVAIVKLLEDRLNAEPDTAVGGVRVVLLVEDSVVHVSTFLPVIYMAIMDLTRRLIDEGLNHFHRQLRMRSRAKVLLASSFEEAVDVYRRFRPYMLGVITDVRFRREGRPDDEAGFELVRMLRRDMPDLPICIQSAEPEKNRARAEALQAYFIDKNSKGLMEDLQRFLREALGFGDFIFRLPDGREIARAGNPRELLDRLREVPPASLLHHAEKQHFSHWMMARTEIRIAEQLYPKRVEDFRDAEELRAFLIRVIENVLYEKQSDIITRFLPGRNPYELQFMRWGEGSLGGKARGIGFLRYLLSRLEFRSQFPEMAIQIPPTLVICSNEFVRFLEDNRLWEPALEGGLEAEALKRRFLEGRLRPQLVEDLRAWLQAVHEPLAVRSSSILEDSHNLPLAGIYATYMLPNSEETIEERLASLLAAVRLVWASTFGESPRAYFRQTGYRLEDERMSVVVQTLGGRRRGGWFYPTFSGVAQSRNFYPLSYMKPEDGVAQVALGLGKTVVEGGAIVRFCPRYPLLLPQFADMRDWLYFTQKHFYALDMSPVPAPRDPATLERLRLLPLSVAEADRVLPKVASVYQSDSGLLVDSFFYEGPRVVTFQKVLRDARLRFGELLAALLTVCERSMRIPVEIEFACELPEEGRPVFYPLQLRPMASRHRWERVAIPPGFKERAFCYSQLAHGNGWVEGVYDLLCVKPETFDISRTREIAREIGEANRRLVEERRPYVLVGFGRWGSTDPRMGIGVSWAQISGVRVLVEVGLPGFNVEPAQGTHFFQNVTTLNIGCLTVPCGSPSFIRWEPLRRNAETVHESSALLHLRWKRPLEICIDGLRGEGVIVLPEEPGEEGA